MNNISFLVLTFVISGIPTMLPNDKKAGQTEITKWPHNKQSALCFTFDSGTINQFKVAIPMMDKLGYPATIFIVTGDIKGSRCRGGIYWPSG